MEAQSCILDTVWSIYLCQEEMSHCNACVCYHEITRAFWELGNTSPCLCLQQTVRNYLMVISNPKCLIPATKRQGKNKQLLHCYERSRSFPLTKILVIEDALRMQLHYLYACTQCIYGCAVYYAYRYKYIVIGTIFRCAQTLGKKMCLQLINCAHIFNFITV